MLGRLTAVAASAAGQLGVPPGDPLAPDDTLACRPSPRRPSPEGRPRCRGRCWPAVRGLAGPPMCGRRAPAGRPSGRLASRAAPRCRRRTSRRSRSTRCCPTWARRCPRWIRACCRPRARRRPSRPLASCSRRMRSRSARPRRSRSRRRHPRRACPRWTDAWGGTSWTPAARFVPLPPSGWQAAQTTGPPVHGDRTSAGLPVRVPQANIFPGTAAGLPTRDGGATGGMPAYRQAPAGHQTEHPTGPQPALPRRSADQARSRLSGFQLGSREAEGRAPRAGEEASR